MSNGDLWMPLYVGDYLIDTVGLNGAQHGAYLLLLMRYWKNGPLQDDDTKLAAWACTDRKLWTKHVGPRVREFFTKGDDGLLHQKRLDRELEKAALRQQLSAEKRFTDNDRLRAWRAKNSHNGPEPPPKPNGETPDETRFTEVSKRVAKRPGNAGETGNRSTTQYKERERDISLSESYSPRERNRNGKEIPWRSPAFQLIYDEGIAKEASKAAEDRQKRSGPQPLDTTVRRLGYGS